MRVVLPAPFGPTNPRTSPGATENETSRRASTGPRAAARISGRRTEEGGRYRLLRLSTLSIDQAEGRQLVEERVDVARQHVAGDAGQLGQEAVGQGTGVCASVQR